MSTKISSRPRKQRQKDDMKQDIVVQVHKAVKRASSSERENIKKIEQTEDSSESNRTIVVEDKNDNYPRTPSRDVSVDGETQINSKILNLIETEMRRENNKHSHFTDSRPQSLSFYEDEKIPEELSGNLELLSPEERKHYKRRKEYLDIDMERNAYNNLQGAINRENEDMIINGTKKSKSKKKKHTNEPELGLGDSREMMIPKEKRKSKKKKRDFSPLSSSSNKRKHKKRDEEFEPKNDITLALEDLQDDVFENSPEDFCRPERIKKSPRKSDKVYVQKKNKFEVASRPEANPCRLNMPINDLNWRRRVLELTPVELAVGIQKYWLPFTLICHGFLGGLALAHYYYLYCNSWNFDAEYLNHYANYSDVYTCLFYILCVICLLSVFDRYDVSHIDVLHIRDLIKCRKSSIVILIYSIALIVHLVAATGDDKIALLSYNYTNFSYVNITNNELRTWSHLSFWRATLASVGWGVLACVSSEDLFYIHLKNMEKYVVTVN